MLCHLTGYGKQFEPSLSGMGPGGWPPCDHCHLLKGNKIGLRVVFRAHHGQLYYHKGGRYSGGLSFTSTGQQGHQVLEALLLLVMGLGSKFTEELRVAAAGSRPGT